MTRVVVLWLSIVVMQAVWPALAVAQSLGTFKWQLQPFCNVITVNVTGVAGVYTVEGFDDQCGAATRAPLTGVATPNPNGTIGFGLNLVTTPGGRGIQVDARISIATLGGTWTDSAGHFGSFAFNANTGGSPRPLPAALIPAVFGLGADGGFLAGGIPNQGTIPASGQGARMMWFPAKQAFRAGWAQGTEWDPSSVGDSSAALGSQVTASGTSSFAAGRLNQATGSASIALGGDTLASGSYALAAGRSNAANGFASIALGYQARADGMGSVALGRQSIAGADHSLALGYGVVTSGAAAIALGNNLDATGAASVVLGTRASTTFGGQGSFIYGDNSSPNTMQSFFPNEFKVRAAGGTFFYSNPDLTTGVRLVAGANAWSSLSDVNSKENFRDLDSHDLLTKLASMSIREWNYKAQAAAIRHVGPTAQDFHAAFGLGEDPLRISTIDADGIALAGVSALARENAALKVDVAALRSELASLRAALVAVPSPR